MNEGKLLNAKIILADYYYIGHLNSGSLRLVLAGDGWQVCTIPTDPYGYNDLFRVCDINAEDGVCFSSLTGKYCRVLFDEDDKVAALYHIVNDNIVFHPHPEADGKDPVIKG